MKKSTKIYLIGLMTTMLSPILHAVFEVPTNFTWVILSIPVYIGFTIMGYSINISDE